MREIKGKTWTPLPVASNINNMPPCRAEPLQVSRTSVGSFPCTRLTRDLCPTMAM